MNAIEKYSIRAAAIHHRPLTFCKANAEVLAGSSIVRDVQCRKIVPTQVERSVSERQDAKDWRSARKNDNNSGR